MVAGADILSSHWRASSIPPFLGARIICLFTGNKRGSGHQPVSALLVINVNEMSI